MTKKLLLTTALVSALSAATSANAALIPITYTGNDQFTFNSAPYAGFSALNTAIGAAINAGTFSIDDDFDIDQTTKLLFVTDLLNSASALRTDAVASVADANGLDPSLVSQIFNRLSTEYATFDAVTKARIAEEFSLEALFNTDIGEFADELDAGGIHSEYTTVIDTLSTNNAILAEIKQLRADIAALSDAEIERLHALFSQVASIKEILEVRNKASTQENLKDRVASITKNLATASSNTRGLEALSELKKDLDQYLVKNVTADNANSVPEVQKPDTAVTSSLLNSLQTRSVIDSRVGGFSGAASGDLMQTYGVWGQGSLSRGTQKAYGIALGYKFDQKGITIGADTGDETLLGAAYSFFANDIKNKDNSSNKEDVKSHILTIYGKFDITNEAFLTGQGQYGKSYIKKKRATGDLANNIADGKTNASTAALKLEVGYDYEAAPQIHLVPAVGVSYTNIDIKGYTESGLGLNRTIGKRTANRTSGLASITAKYVVDMEQVKLIPEIHANIDYAFSTKNSDTSVTIINGIDPIATPSEKISKGFYTIGGSVKAIHSSMYEISGGLDLGLAKKFQSTTGTLKLRVNL